MRKVSDTNRNKLEIIAEILRQIRIPAGKTSIMSRCNMNTAQSEGYLKLMRSSDLIRRDAIAGKITYQRTESGLQFLELYNKMALLLDQSALAPPLMLGR
jgi:predicted transcriptional regulator